MTNEEILKELAMIYTQANKKDDSIIRSIIDNNTVIPVFNLIRMLSDKDLVYVRFECNTDNTIIITHNYTDVFKFEIPTYFITNINFIAACQDRVIWKPE